MLMHSLRTMTFDELPDKVLQRYVRRWLPGRPAWNPVWLKALNRPCGCTLPDRLELYSDGTNTLVIGQMRVCVDGVPSSPNQSSWYQMGSWLFQPIIGVSRRSPKDPPNLSIGRTIALTRAFEQCLFVLAVHEVAPTAVASLWDEEVRS